MKKSYIAFMFAGALSFIGLLSYLRVTQFQNQVLGAQNFSRRNRWVTPTQRPTLIPTLIPTIVALITPTNNPLPTATNTPTVTPTKVPPTNTPIPATPTPIRTGGISWGEYAGWLPSSFDAFETLVGKTPNHIATFVHWGNENQFPVDLGAYAKNKNEKLIIFWEAMDYNFVGPRDSRFSYDAILRGDWNSYLTSFASQVKAYGNDVTLILFEEMNGDWYPWSGTINGNSAAKHIAAYRYVHSFFANVPNAKFGWDINNDNVPDVTGNKPTDYYPGDEYVDYVGMNGFNFGNPWQNFADVFSNNLPKLEAMNKPIYLFSVASAPGSNKADWIKNLGTYFAAHQKIVGWTWFNENKEKDWRVNSDANSLAAFKSILP